MFKPLTLIISLLVGMVLLTSCKSPSRSNSTDDTIDSTTLESANVPANFDWKTFTEYEFTIDAGQAGLLEVLTLRGGVYHRAFLNGREAYTFLISLPTYEKQVKIRHQGQEAVIDLSAKSIIHTFKSNTATTGKGEIVMQN